MTTTAATGEGTKVRLHFQGNLGYGPDQVEGGLTLGDLLEFVEEAITEWGPEAEVVLLQTNNGRGANYGALHSFQPFSSDVEDEDDDY